jgi:NodT family efflux transporter outer membrane factor (OMF) lipoprotein
VVDSLQRSSARLPHLLRIRPKPGAAPGGHARAAGARPAGIAVGNFFPQTQQITADYRRYAESTEVPNRQNVRAPFYNQGTYGFSAAWELDFWGRFRRAVESTDASLDASVEDYDYVLVTLLGDVATYYAQVRIFEQRIAYARANVVLLRQTLTIAEARFKAGTTAELDVLQARSILEQTEAQISELEISLRQANNQLCVLLGLPPEELQAKLGAGGIPTATTEVAAGIPADLLRRRPDVRRAERLAAAQSAQIGVAEADFYPHFSITGTIGYSSGTPRLNALGVIANLVPPAQPLAANIGPTVQWNILNYGRILNNVRFQDARFQELVAAYQNTVLTAAQDVENGLVTFLKAQDRTRLQAASVEDSQKAVRIVLAQYQARSVDFTRVAQIVQNLVFVMDTLAQARGEVGLGLIQIYRALGGGWQIRLKGCAPTDLPGQGVLPAAKETLPSPRPALDLVPPKPTPK